jgi:monovalent cation/hydrogen antiporter
MSVVHRFEIVLMLVAACIGLSRLAKRYRLPEASTLILGGLAVALIPNIPDITLDPDLVLVLFLPPLLLRSAYLSDVRAFRDNWWIILHLATGAVVFTTLVVGVTTHFVAPNLPWAACFALGAIVSPPDAVAASAILKHLPLPSRTVTLLEGESLLNDATGLVLYRMSVVAALTGAFSGLAASETFLGLTVGGIVAGIACGYIANKLVAHVLVAELAVTASFLCAWGSYILGDALHVSGILTTATCGLIMGWRQHSTLGAQERLQSQAVWRVTGFVLESLIFILIGLSLRSVVGGLHRQDATFASWLIPLGSIVIAVVAARFVWIFIAAYGVRAALPGLRRRDPYPPVRIPLVMSWAGMRGVVSLAAALALPEGFPGRNFLQLTTFVVILITVLVQGTTLAPLIRLLGFHSAPRAASATLTEADARRRIIAAELAAIEHRSSQEDGSQRHPRLVEQYRYRLNAVTRAVEARGAMDYVRVDHFDTVLAAVSAGREELLRLRNQGVIDNLVLNALERELDGDELQAKHLLMTGSRA